MRPVLRPRAPWRVELGADAGLVLNGVVVSGQPLVVSKGQNLRTTQTGNTDYCSDGLHGCTAFNPVAPLLAHHEADHYERVAGAVASDVDVAIGLSHTPEPRVVDSFTADGFNLVMSGHTHGGQLRVPGYGALVSNCGLDPKLARGLTRWSERSWLHVSAGLGTSPYAPVRFACPPEASLLTLVAR